MAGYWRFGLRFEWRLGTRLMPAASEMKPSSATTRALWSDESVEPTVEKANNFKASAPRKQKSIVARTRPWFSNGLIDESDSHSTVMTPDVNRIVAKTKAVPSLLSALELACSRPSAWLGLGLGLEKADPNPNPNPNPDPNPNQQRHGEDDRGQVHLRRVHACAHECHTCTRV